jgi:integrase
MPTARKLPSGSWHCKVFTGYDDAGKRIYKSFTVKDKSRNGKKKCEQIASEWSANRPDPDNPRVQDVVRNYIGIKSAVLSPSTIRGYNLYLKRMIDGTISELDNQKTQRWINGLSADYSPKYIKNIYGLLSSALLFYGYRPPSVTLPAHAPNALYTPCDADIRRLLEYVWNRPPLRSACLLGAFGSLRRGEICALTAEDVSGNRIRVNKSMIRGSDDIWHVRPMAKTDESNRVVVVPEFVPEYLTIPVGLHPEQISNRFRRAVRSCGCPQHFRFHDLRHYYVSIAHALGVPDAYIMAMGGWKTDNVMHRVYRDTLPDIMRSEQDKLSNHFAFHVAYAPQNAKKTRTSAGNMRSYGPVFVPAVGLEPTQNDDTDADCD